VAAAAVALAVARLCLPPVDHNNGDTQPR